MWASNVGNMQACCLCEGRSDLCFVFASCGFKKCLHDPHFAAVSQTSLYSAHHNLTNSNWLAEVMLKDSVHHHFAHGAASPPSNSLTTMASPRYTLTLVNSLHLGNVAITRTVFWLFLDWAHQLCALTLCAFSVNTILEPMIASDQSSAAPTYIGCAVSSVLTTPPASFLPFTAPPFDWGSIPTKTITPTLANTSPGINRTPGCCCLSTTLLPNSSFARMQAVIELSSNTTPEMYRWWNSLLALGSFQSTGCSMRFDARASTNSGSSMQPAASFHDNSGSPMQLLPTYWKHLACCLYLLSITPSL